MNLEGRVAIVTGGSRGIGRGIVLALAQANAKVTFCYSKDEQGARKTEAEVQALGGTCLPLRGDVSKYSEASEVVAKTVEVFGGVDILVNNAGIAGSRCYLADADEENFRQVIDTHVMGSFHFAKAALPHLRKRKRADIYFISSVAALNFRAGTAAYSIAKASLEAMTKCLAKEELRYNIRVNAIGPGTIESDMTLQLWKNWHNIEEMSDLDSIMPFGRTGKPEDIGNLIVFLASAEGAWISGQVIYVDGGARAYSIARLLAEG